MKTYEEYRDAYQELDAELKARREQEADFARQIHDVGGVVQTSPNEHGAIIGIRTVRRAIGGREEWDVIGSHHPNADPEAPLQLAWGGDTPYDGPHHPEIADPVNAFFREGMELARQRSALMREAEAMLEWWFKGMDPPRAGGEGGVL